MAQLIPLRLGSSDINLEQVPKSSTPTEPISSPPIPAKSKARQRRPGPVTDLTIFPYTQEEWIKVMDEVKRLYVKRQYKQCSARCIQILDNIKDPYRVHPLHSIYLSFYTASSLELTARTLHVNSSNKMLLLQQSLSYYQKAEGCMEYAIFSADPTTIQSARRRSSSISSSIRSSVDSVFSRFSTCSAASSFSDSGSDNEQTQNRSSSSLSTTSYEGPLSPAPLRVRKKVSFYPKLPTVVSETDLATSIEDSNLIDAFPAPPNSPTPPEQEETPGNITTYLLSCSLNRYRTHLSALHIQLAYHIGSLNAQIHTLQTCRKARRSNLPNLFTTDFGNGGMDGVDKEEMRSVELKARIAKLKAAGWRRERFNGERYQILADKAIAELE